MRRSALIVAALMLCAAAARAEAPAASTVMLEDLTWVELRPVSGKPLRGRVAWAGRGE